MKLSPHCPSQAKAYTDYRLRVSGSCRLSPQESGSWLRSVPIEFVSLSCAHISPPITSGSHNPYSQAWKGSQPT